MNLEQIETEVTRALEPAFRTRLLAQGQARSLIWRAGVLPVGSPSFSDSLSHDLISYGDALLLLALRIRQAGGDEQLARKAFNQAGEALEAVIADGNPKNPERGFLRILSAAAYHLGRSSARAYSMLVVSLNDSNLSKMEYGLALLILRRLDQLEGEIYTWSMSDETLDQSLISSLTKLELPMSTAVPTKYTEDLIFFALDTALCEHYYSGLGDYLLALQTGEASLLDQALEKFKTGRQVAFVHNLVPQWWCLHLTIGLIDDLWKASFHNLLPETMLDGPSTEWAELRSLFIASLYRRSRSEIELWPSQVEGARRATDASDNLVISLPTSAGKTRIAELCILRCLIDGSRVVYVTPLRALSAQTEFALQKTFVCLGKSVSALYGSIGLSAFDEDTLRSRDIVVATPEKLDFALRNDPSLLDNVGLVILDEGHMIGLGEREIRYEVQIQRLLNRSDANKRRIVCLSAVFPNGNEFEDFVRWLRRDADGAAIRLDWRPTRLRFGEVLWQGTRARLELRVDDERPFVPSFFKQKKPKRGRRTEHFPRDKRELVIATAWRQLADNQSVLIYCPQRKSVNPFAKAIVDLESRGFIKTALRTDAEKLTKALTIGCEWLGSDHPILKCLKLGVAIHHGALPTPFRKEIEQLLRDNVLKVTISSPTLAQGLNLTATSIVMQDIYHFRTGKRQRISASEFNNIVGRAGRAFVDVEGLVLYPIFDNHFHQRRQWEALVNASVDEKLESGLVLVVRSLLNLLDRALGKPDVDELIEFVLNNVEDWEYPHNEEESGDNYEFNQSKWIEHLSTLDTAVLSLFGEEDVEIGNLSARLDELLSSSLWERRLKHREEKFREAYIAVLNARTTYIWKKSSSAQRRGYFLAGVGLTSGQELDNLANELNPLVLEASRAIEDKDSERAINAIESLAQRLFEIKPFDPLPLPDNWNEALELWLRGEPITNASTTDDKMLRFIENGLVFKLPWAIEAVRVRAAANKDTIDINGKLQAFEEIETEAIVSCLETGTLNTCATRLIQAGFASRLGAIAAVTDTDATFSTRSELKSWVYSPAVMKLSSNECWPTPESHELWLEFVNQYTPRTNEVWQIQHENLPVTWKGEEFPPAGEIVRLRFAENGECAVFSASFEELGKVSIRLTRRPIGLIDARVSDDGSLTVQYKGPNDFDTQT